MACCCDGITDLGCINYCDTVSTGFTAPSTATFRISLIESGGYLNVSGTIGNEITFTNPFNEDSVTLFQILLNGQPQILNGNNCFKIEVNPGKDLT